MSNRDQYLKDLEAQFELLGLNIRLNLVKLGGRWAQTLNNKRISFAISQTLLCNLHTFLYITFYNQNEVGRAAAVRKLTTFMGYAPFCRYKLNNKARAPVTFEWSLSPEANFTIRKNSNTIYNLARIDDGFIELIPKDFESFFKITTVSEVIRLQLENGKVSDLMMNGVKTSLLLPFVKKFLPRIAAKQIEGSLTIINLEKTVNNIEGAVSYALEPLIKHEIISTELSGKIIDWFTLRLNPGYNNDMMKMDVHVCEAIAQGHYYDLYVTDTKTTFSLRVVPRVHSISILDIEIQL